MTTFYLLILFMLPAVMAVGIAIPRRRELSAQWVGELVIATALLVLGAMLALCRLPVGTVIVSPVVGLSFTFGGFQRLYGLVVCFMWLICAMLSPQYFRGHRHLRRYYFFFLICLSFTLGVFLSADLKTTFLFFELMSLGSYVWVVQEETPEALEAIADQAIARNIGARGLRAVMEGILTQIMYDIPSDPTIVKVTITRECVEGKGQPELERDPNRTGHPVKLNTGKGEKSAPRPAS